MRVVFLLCAVAVFAQDPYKVAGNHYHLVFENDWVRATRVDYGPYETAEVHNHPPNPVTVYVYVTDGGAIEFHHVTGDHVAGFTITRKPVQAGAIRVAHGGPETHTVKYLGNQSMEYVRLELRTEAIDRPTRDVRLSPKQTFENGQMRIVRVHCDAGVRCAASDHPNDPSVVIEMSGPRQGEVLWCAPAAVIPLSGPLELVRVDLKSRPVQQK